ncbi:MAG TPA: hypothetical protein VFU23_05285, partial [Gemmatimonadales bacterium]|nr:hypothetical protein [Gemmatimonadales bacterium]
DQTDLPHVLRGGLKLGLLYSVLVAVFAILQVRLEGSAELMVCGIIFLIGISALIVLPGQWTRARTIEGIAGAAGIGLASVFVFLVIDVALFQPLHIYSNRWLEIGGGSNWWYHPVWWMVCTYITWMGAWIQAHQVAKSGSASPAMLVIGTVVLSLVVLAVSVVAGVPNAGWNLGSFAVAVLPALAIYTLISSFGVKRR